MGDGNQHNCEYAGRDSGCVTLDRVKTTDDAGMPN